MDFYFIRVAFCMVIQMSFVHNTCCYVQAALVLNERPIYEAMGILEKILWSNLHLYEFIWRVRVFVYTYCSKIVKKLDF